MHKLDPIFYFYLFAGTQVGSQVAVITANDVDNPVLRYSFTPQGNHDNMFTMEKFSGKIILAKRLDHESKKHYVLGLQVGTSPCSTSR